MKSIGSRITLLVRGHRDHHACVPVRRGALPAFEHLSTLDALTPAQFKQLKYTLGPNYKTLTPATIDDRIREATESASSLFYIDMHGPMTNRFFRSNNLRGQTIPDIPGERAYTVEVNGIGELRVSEFLLPPFEVTVATPMAPVRDVMSGYRKVFFALLVVMLIVSIAIGYALSELMLRPVRVIQATANRIRSDNLNERIPVGDVKDEISRLARFLNQMFDRLETSFSEIRRFTADASHELKTPLSLVRLHAERLLVNGNLEPAQKEAVHVQLEELARVNRIIDELLFLSRADAQAITVDMKEQAPAAFLQSFAQDASALAEHHGRRCTRTRAKEPSRSRKSACGRCFSTCSPTRSTPLRRKAASRCIPSCPKTSGGSPSMTRDPASARSSVLESSSALSVSTTRARKTREAALALRYAAASCNCIAGGSSRRPARTAAGCRW